MAGNKNYFASDKSDKPDKADEYEKPVKFKVTKVENGNYEYDTIFIDVNSKTVQIPVTKSAVANHHIVGRSIFIPYQVVGENEFIFYKALDKIEF